MRTPLAIVREVFQTAETKSRCLSDVTVIFTVPPSETVVRQFVHESFQPFRRVGAVNHILQNRVALSTTGISWEVGTARGSYCFVGLLH